MIPLLEQSILDIIELKIFLFSPLKFSHVVTNWQVWNLGPTHGLDPPELGPGIEIHVHVVALWMSGCVGSSVATCTLIHCIQYKDDEKDDDDHNGNDETEKTYLIFEYNYTCNEHVISMVQHSNNRPLWISWLNHNQKPTAGHHINECTTCVSMRVQLSD